MKSILKQWLPPILIPPAKKLREIAGSFLGSEVPAVVVELRRLHEERNASVDADEIALRDDLLLKLHPDSRSAFVHFCYLSPEMVEEMDCFLRLTKGKSHLLDVGALHGVFSLAFTAHSTAKKALAVDASPLAFAHLLYNIHKNPVHSIVPIECALSDQPGQLSMHYEWEHAVAAGTAAASGSVLSIPKRTGDELCESQAFLPDVIKIDVEGHEVKVLKGLRQTLGTAKPIVFLEVHPSRILEEGDDYNEILRLFGELGYSIESMKGATVSSEQAKAITHDERFVFMPSAS